MKLLFVGDVHLSDRAPSTRTDDYSTQILTKLAEVGEIAIREGCQVIVYAGDIFHSKIPHRTSHALTQKAMQIFRAQREIARVVVVPGNHDYYGANPDELERAPLGTVARGRSIDLIGLPEKRSVQIPPPPSRVTLWGIREEEPIEAFAEVEYSRLSTPGEHVIVAHSAIFPKGQEPPFSHFKADEVAAQTGVRIILYGHIHDPHGVYEENGVLFCNPGSLSRGSLWETDSQRIPQVALIDTISATARLIPLRTAEPWEKVFRITEEHEKRDRSLAAAEFAEELVAASVEVFDVERVVASLRERDDVSSRVKERAVELVEKVSG